MKFVPTPLGGAYVIELEPSFDERGFFARSWSAEEFKDRGLAAQMAQCSISFNTRKGTLRGMHYQVNRVAKRRKWPAPSYGSCLLAPHSS